MFIAEKGIDIPAVEVDLRHEEQLGDAFRAVNPRCTVPVLELDDGSVLTESLAICHYLESQFPDPNLMGLDGQEQAMVIEWYERTVVDGFLAAAETFRNRAKGFKGRAITGPDAYEQIPQLVERGYHRLERYMEALDQRLGDSPFVALERFTLADIAAFVTVEFAGWVKMPVAETWPHIGRWHGVVAHRPSASL
jgi:glutathione S-transferase